MSRIRFLPTAVSTLFPPILNPPATSLMLKKHEPPSNHHLLVQKCQSFKYSSQNTDFVISENIGSDQKICLIGLNRPPENAIDDRVLTDLSICLESFYSNKHSRIAVLYGKGGNFCTTERETNDSNHNQANNMHLDAWNILDGLYRSKPIIAALSGHVIGHGVEIACMCDLRVMEDTAVIGLSHYSSDKVIPDVFARRLVGLIGLSRSMDLALTGRPINADEALSFGLVNLVVATGTAIGRGVQIATTISTFPPDIVNANRQTIYRMAQETLSSPGLSENR